MRHGHRGDLWLLAIAQVLVPLVEALLRLPRVRDDEHTDDIAAWLDVLEPDGEAHALGERHQPRQLLVGEFVQQPVADLPRLGKRD